ncbi:LysR family transcriptional regulator [Photobacterium alginatilyticum]|uniref:LysR family transcriptional regulator n=1 Tax=Photobacterium alginatilyticum TaxID=1775171 RepID=A0ABW9YDV0_9GAMM|nr:LysR family transcriptional regulator [Photobacterium alginatilyticum]NBI51836.1 LysR family transcriptional regulator [Photobacterium alginatilyticum]
MKNIEASGNEFFSSEKHSEWVWDDTRSFLAVARTGTLSGAASELKISIATLSRRIERLESALKLPLFIRHQSGYQLTAEGSALLEKAEAIETAARNFSSQVATHTTMAGRVRFATAENLANAIILPALPEFYRKYPQIIIELVTDTSTVNLHSREADLALRMVRPTSGNVMLRKLGKLGYGLYASKGYLSKRQSEVDSNIHSGDLFIGWDERKSHLITAQWLNKALKGSSPILTTTSLLGQIEAAKAGLGIAVLPHFLALESGLVCVEADIGLDQSIYLAIQADMAHSPRIRVFADFIVDLVEQNRHKLSGNNE